MTMPPRRSAVVGDPGIPSVSIGREIRSTRRCWRSPALRHLRYAGAGQAGSFDVDVQRHDHQRRCRACGGSIPTKPRKEPNDMVFHIRFIARPRPIPGT